MKKPIVLPADVYDTLELSALAYGGIGKGYWFDAEYTAPLCILGHASWVDGYDGRTVFAALRQSFRAAGFRFVGEANDSVVPEGGRIQFATWCQRLNVVRGE